MDGYWANENNWMIMSVDTSTGIINSNWAIGLRADVTDVVFEVTDIIGYYEASKATSLTFGTMVNSGTTNEYGQVYYLTQGWTSNTDLGAFNVGVLNEAVAGGVYELLSFYIYNPNETDVVFYFMEDVTWAKTELTILSSKSWTKVVITPELIEANKSYLLYVGVESGAGTSGWQISPIYAAIAE